ncbi:UNVERIFIED_CONTAM: hypothetical protein Sradi_6152800 [Sesamum radiatum]|uniref:Uncharacterized protein n=1 Tax=Sesamum radiatum TaxID=300843 RepID=A0AAW2KK80_SESRA
MPAAEKHNLLSRGKLMAGKFGRWIFAAAGPAYPSRTTRLSSAPTLTSESSNNSGAELIVVTRLHLLHSRGEATIVTEYLSVRLRGDSYQVIGDSIGVSVSP